MSITKKVQLPVIIEQDEDRIYIVSCPNLKPVIHLVKP